MRERWKERDDRRRDTERERGEGGGGGKERQTGRLKNEMKCESVKD